MHVSPEPPHSAVKYTWQHLWVWLCTMWPNWSWLRSRRIQLAHPHSQPSCTVYFWLVFTQASREKETTITNHINTHCIHNIHAHNSFSCISFQIFIVLIKTAIFFCTISTYCWFIFLTGHIIKLIKAVLSVIVKLLKFNSNVWKLRC
jgi:hypothetical protein